MIVRVALLQLPSCGFDQDRALTLGLSACRTAREMGADLALFPEMWNIGYSPMFPEALEPGFDPAEARHSEAVRAWQARAITANDPFCRAFARLATELEMAIVLTFLEAWQGPPRNSAVLFDRHGRSVLTYAKVHTCGFSQEAFCTPGDGFPVADLDTAAGSVRVGLMICFDREFPESARVLAVQGAELILVPNACDLEDNRLAQIRSRAFENAAVVAVANYPAPAGNGRSVACSPIAFDPRGSPLDPWLLQAPAGEGVFLASFDLETIRKWRSDEPWGTPWRKPLAYGPLTLPVLIPGLAPPIMPPPHQASQPETLTAEGSASTPAHPGGEITLQPARPGDLPTILDLDRVPAPTMEGTAPRRPDGALSGSPVGDPGRARGLRHRLETGELRLIQRGEAPVGFLVLTREFFERPFLSLLVIAERERNAGIGTRVLQTLLTGRREELFTSTNRSNARMIHLLGKVGFRSCGIIDHLDPGDPELIFHWEPPIPPTR